MDKPTHIVFSKSTRQGKKYRVDFLLGKEPYTRHFGALGYDQFKDSTPLKLYSQFDHGNPERRRLYYARHGPSNDPKSARYWSHRYLW